MSMNNAARKGFRKGLPFNLGVFAGFSIVMLLCMAFSKLLFTLIPRIAFPMKIAGAAYMLYLIWTILRPSKSHGENDGSGGFFAGAALQFINVKIMIYGITAMSSYILPHYSALPLLILFSLLLAFVGFTGTLCWSAFGTLFSRLFRDHKLIMDVIMVILLLYCAVSLFL
jgi:threonine/homoserine/homoserine lactone efflux protein